MPFCRSHAASSREGADVLASSARRTGERLAIMEVMSVTMDGMLLRFGYQRRRGAARLPDRRVGATLRAQFFHHARAVTVAPCFNPEALQQREPHVAERRVLGDDEVLAEPE